MTTQFRGSIDDYTNKVLGVIKERFGLKDKSEALNKFAHMYGEEFVPFEIKEDILRDMIKDIEEDKKLYGNKTMTIEELDLLCDE